MKIPDSAAPLGVAPKPRGTKLKSISTDKYLMEQSIRELIIYAVATFLRIILCKKKPPEGP